MIRKYDLVANSYLSMRERHENYQRHIFKMENHPHVVNDKMPDIASRFITRKGRYISLQRQIYNIGVNNMKMLNDKASSLSKTRPIIIKPKTGMQDRKVDWVEVVLKQKSNTEPKFGVYQKNYYENINNDAKKENNLNESEKENYSHESEKENDAHESEKENYSHESEKENYSHESEKENNAHESEKENYSHESEKENDAHESEKENNAHESEKENYSHESEKENYSHESEKENYSHESEIENDAHESEKENNVNDHDE